jgi:hypothetical protein
MRTPSIICRRYRSPQAFPGASNASHLRNQQKTRHHHLRAIRINDATASSAFQLITAREKAR